jgi:SlyX protein
MTEARLTELEMRTAFQEDALTELNDALVSQQRQLDLLRQELARLREHVLTIQPQEPGEAGQEVPPHY